MRTKRIASRFESELAILRLASLLPTKEISERLKQSPKYCCIANTIDEVGVVEPLVVYRKADDRGQRLLLDGYIRRAILMEKGVTEAECLLSDDDEALTYNKRINRLAVVQEHFLIVRAIDRGISEERLAKVLGVKIDYVRRRRSLLKGICAEAAELLHDKPTNPVVFDAFRNMKPPRQIEACKLMVSAATYSSAYARALLSASKDTDLKRSQRRVAPPIVTAADLSLMERELKTTQKDFKAVEMDYGNDMLNLVIATRYVSELLNRPKIVRYLDDNHPEMLVQFRSLSSDVSTEEPQAPSVDTDNDECQLNSNPLPTTNASLTNRVRRQMRLKEPSPKKQSGQRAPSKKVSRGKRR